MSARAFPPALVLVLAIIAGACMDATIKYLSQTNPVLLVAFGRYLFGAIFSFGIYWQAGRPAISAEMWRAHGVRGFLIAACAVTFFWALSVLPLAEAVTLSFIYPLLAPFVASLLLKERIRASSVACALIGFAGVIVAMQGAPSEVESPRHDLGVAAVLISAAFFSFAMVLLRERAQKDGAPIVGLMTEWMRGNELETRRANGDLGGTMRLGAYEAVLAQGSRVAQIYKSTRISERHRHRYEVNMVYRERLEATGLSISGVSPDGLLPEIVEIPSHPWFIGVQFHPELKSRPFEPHPLFASFIAAAVEQSRLV